MGQQQQQHADFGALYDRYGAEVCEEAFWYRHNRHDAEDIRDEAFLRLLNEREKGEQIANPRAWLLRVARHLAIDQGRSPSCRKRRHDRQAQEKLENLQSSEPAPDEVAVGKERDEQGQQMLRKLPQALATLTEDERAVLVMHDAQGMSCRRIEKMTGQGKSTVARKLPLLRARLRAALGAP